MNQSDLSNEPIGGEGMKVVRVKQEYVEETPSPVASSHAAAPMNESTHAALPLPLNPGSSPNNIDIDALLEVPEAKAVLSSFPPGCICLRVDSNPAALQAVTLGTIRGVFVDLTNKSSAGAFVYRFAPEPPFHHEGAALVRESELRLGPSCPVWASPVHADPEEDQLPAVVIGSYVRPDGVFYSVQDATRNVQYDGIPASSIRYRSDDVSILSEGASEMRPMITTPSSLAGKTVFNRGAPAGEQVGALPRISPQTSEESRPSKKMKHTDEGEQSGCIKSPANSMSITNDGQLQRGLQSSFSSPPMTGHTAEVSSSAREGSSFPTSTSHESNERKRKKTSTLKVVLPNCLVPDDVKELLIGKQGIAHRKLEKTLRCKIQLRGAPFDERKEGRHIMLTGSDDDLGGAARRIEDVLVNSVEDDLQGRLLYLFAKLNNGSACGNAVYCRSPTGSRTNTWAAIVNFRSKDEFEESIAVFVGKGKAKWKALVKECGCSLTRVEPVGRQAPFIYISGESADVVNKAHALIREKWGTAKKVTGSGKRRR